MCKLRYKEHGFRYNRYMSTYRNEIVFPPRDEEIPVAPKAPLPPESGLAEVVGSPLPNSSASGVIPGSEMVTPEVEAAHQMRMRGEESYKKARRFHADVPAVMALLLFLIALIAAASFYVSFSGLYSAAEWAVGINPPLQFAVPIMLDASVVAYSFSLFIKREREEKVLGTWVAIAVFATISATANVLHTLAVSTAVTQSELVIGSIVSGGAPVLLAFAVETIAKLVFKPVKNK